MLSLAVFVIDGDGVAATAATVTLAGNDPLVCPSGDVQKEFDRTNSDLVHFIAAGHLVLPSFYEALVTTIDHEGMDYVFCPALCVGGREKEGETAGIAKPGDSGWHIGSMIVRRWVLQEIGLTPNLAECYGKVTAEYMGVEVPHILFVGN